jgi:phospholipid/cholesterol/gamma-HCH transport system permease protein
VTALLGFMIGIVMGYLMSRQLHAFGADVYIVNILGLSIIRELGPVLMAVLVAGRSGSAMTAQIGVMRVTDEIDALSTMGISRNLRVVLPKVLGLTFVSPLLVLWTSSWALAGGAFASNLELGISFRFFFEYLPLVVQPVNLTLSLIKGLMFGFVVALVACHFGLRIKPNTESLSNSTTSSVVTAISGVILVNALFAILTRGIGV